MDGMNTEQICIQYNQNKNEIKAKNNPAFTF